MSWGLLEVASRWKLTGVPYYTRSVTQHIGMGPSLYMPKKKQRREVVSAAIKGAAKASIAAAGLAATGTMPPLALLGLTQLGLTTIDIIIAMFPNDSGVAASG